MNRYISQRMCTYIGQQDLHHAEMTARETLEFSKELLSSGDAFGENLLILVIHYYIINFFKKNNMFFVL